MLERSAEAPVSWEQYNTEETIRQQILNVNPDIVLLKNYPASFPSLKLMT